jgi:hypothetical protein
MGGGKGQLGAALKPGACCRGEAIGCGIECGYFSGDPRGQHARVKARNALYARTTGDTGLPELFFADAIGCQDAKPCDDDPSLHV